MRRPEPVAGLHLRLSHLVSGLFLPLLLLLAAGDIALGEGPASPPVSVVVEVDVTTITVGDPLRLLLLIHHAPEITLSTTPLEANWAPFEVLTSIIHSPHHESDGTMGFIWEYTLTVFTMGSLEIPSVTVSYVDAAGRPGQVRSPAVPIRVESVLERSPDLGDIREVKPPLPIPGGLLVYLRPGALVALLAALGGLTALGFRRRARVRRGVFQGSLTPPQEATVQELDRIASLHLLEQGDFKTYYAYISSCTRRYLGERYGFPALERTTEELRGELVARGVDRWQARVTVGLLEECDAVRWAQYLPAPQRATRALTLAYEIAMMDGHR